MKFLKTFFPIRFCWCSLVILITALSCLVEYSVDSPTTFSRSISTVMDIRTNERITENSGAIELVMKTSSGVIFKNTQDKIIRRVIKLSESTFTCDVFSNGNSSCY